MRIAIVSFTARGFALAQRTAEELRQQGEDVLLKDGKSDREFSLSEWTSQAFTSCQALVFVGAAGIAVRAVAPCLRDKTRDPAVSVMDEGGRFAISLLSGHIGGANALTRRLAHITGAEAVITTATDLSGAFAVDTWAVERGLRISDPGRIKGVSGKAVAGETVRLRSEFPVHGEPPAGVALTADEADVVCSFFNRGGGALALVPPVGVLGIGCRKGITVEQLEQAWQQLCRETGLSPLAVRAAASIDLKAREPGLLAFCAARGWPLSCRSAGELKEVPGEFTASEFVRSMTGVDNVCERAAVLESGGTLVLPKWAHGGVSFAFAAEQYILELGERE